MSADPWDPPAIQSPALSRVDVWPLSPDELAHIRADIHAWDHDDRHCLPQLFAKALGFIEARATEGDPQAIQTLRVMAVRSTSGIPFGEPAEPAWSLDPEPRDRPYEITLGPDELEN